MSRVAVIGSGPAGLVTLKSLLQHGFAAKCLEGEASIGGLWNYRAQPTPYTGYEDRNLNAMSYPVYKSMKANTAWYNTTFSDFLPDCVLGEARHYDVLDYLQRYTDHFSLTRHIQCNSYVTQLNKYNNKWIVSYNIGNQPCEESFDKVLIATGAVRFPMVPTFSNEQEYKGVCVHSSQVRDENALFKNKRVFLLGGGYSGTDLATLALKRDAKHVSIIPTTNYPHKNVWIWNRRGEIFNAGMKNQINQLTNGFANLEWDYQMTYENSVASDEFHILLRESTMNIFDEKSHQAPTFGYDIAGITDSTNYLREQIDSGHLAVYKSPVDKFGCKSVILKDSTIINDIDVVVKATGYVHRFPFLDHLLDVEQQKKCELYKCMIPAQENLDGVAFVLIQRSLVVVNVAEMNARWLCQKFVPKPYISQNGNLHTEDERNVMTSWIETQRRIVGGASMTFTRNAAVHIDQLANEIDCAPPDYKRLLSSSNRADVELGVALFHGPFIGTRYRLQGIAPLPNARQALVSVSRQVLGTRFQSLVNQYIHKNRQQQVV